MAQRKKKLTKKKRHAASREPETDSDGDFELAVQIKDDDSVSNKALKLPTHPSGSHHHLSVDLCVNACDLWIFPHRSELFKGCSCFG